MISRDGEIRRSQREVKCEAKRNSRFSELTDMLITRKTFFCLFAKSRALRQDDGAFEDLPTWTSFCPRSMRQVGCTWLGQLMKRI